MPLELIKTSDFAKWDAAVARSRQGSIFCRSAFLESLGAPFSLYLVEENGKPLLGCPVLFGADGVPRTSTHPYTMYQGPWLSGELEALSTHSRFSEGMRAADFLLAGLEKELDRLHFESHWRYPDLRSFSWFHYSEGPRVTIDLAYTGIIDLKAHADFPAYLGSIRKSRRQEYRSLAEGGLRVESLPDVNTFLALYRSTFARQDIEVSPASLALVGSITERALRDGYGKLYLCFASSGEPVSASLFLHDENTAYYLFGANDPAWRHLPGGSLVLLEGIRQAFQLGLGAVDVVGINSPQRGAFKSSFNAAPAAYYSLNWKK